MDLPIAFLLYAALFRLAVLLTGLVCILLGFRLFVRGLGGDPSDASFEAGGAKLSLRNAAPGTCFALFGAGLVVAMLVTGNPELALRSAERATRPDGGAHETVQVTQLKGGSGDPGSAAAFDALVEFGASREQAGDRAGAIAAYAQALSQGDVPLAAAALPLHRVAALYHAEGRHEEALPLARLAASLTGDDPDLLHLLARILEARGETGEALVAARAAVELSPERDDFQATVAQLRQAELARSE